MSFKTREEVSTFVKLKNLYTKKKSKVVVANLVLAIIYLEKDLEKVSKDSCDRESLECVIKALKKVTKTKAV